MEFLGMPKKRTRAAGYPRVSDENLEGSATLESQTDAIRLYAEKHGYELEDSHIYPEAMTAYYRPFRDRPQLMQLLEDARHGEFDVVIVNEYSRLARRQVEQAVIIDLLDKCGVKVESVTEKFEDSPIGHFMRAVYAFLSEIEREKIMERTSRGKRKKARNGHLLGQGAAKYGYKYNAERTAYLYNTDVMHVDTNDVAWTEASVVEYIFANLAERVSQHRIALLLNQNGVPTRKGGPWIQSTIKKIAKDPQYTGDARVFRFGVENGKGFRRPEEEHIMLPEGTIPPIVSKDLFAAVQLILKDNKAFSERNNGDPCGSLLRGGLCRCGICNHTMHVQRYITFKAGKPSEYFCHRNNDTIGDHSVNILVSIADANAWEVAMEHIKDPSLLAQSSDAFIAELKKDTDTQEVIAEQLADLKRRYKNLWTLAENCTDNGTLADLTARLKSLEKEKHNLEGMKREIEDEEELKEKIAKELSKFIEWADKVRPLLSDPEYVPTYQEKRFAILILGIRAKVWPVKGVGAQNGTPYRVKIEVAPPNIMTLFSEYGLLMSS